MKRGRPKKKVVKLYYQERKVTNWRFWGIIFVLLHPLLLLIYGLTVEDNTAVIWGTISFLVMMSVAADFNEKPEKTKKFYLNNVKVEEEEVTIPKICMRSKNETTPHPEGRGI